MHFLIYNIKRVCNIKKMKDIIGAIMAKKAENIIKISNNIFCFLAIYLELGRRRRRPLLQMFD